MKNSKIIFILFSIFFSLITCAQSEKRFYVSVNSGYNIGTGNPNYYQTLVFRNINSTQTSATNSTSEIVKVNLGKGINVGANFGYMFTKNLGFELGANYLLGSTVKAASISYTGNYSNSDVSGKMIQIKPTLVFRSGFEKINPYAKVGMIIGSGKIINNQNFKDGADLADIILELDGGMPIGFNASIGTLYAINSKISIFGELNLVSLEYAPKKGRYSKYIENGIDLLPLFDINDKEFELVDSFTETGAPPNANEPTKNAILPVSFSSFGVNVGVQYQF